MTKEEIAEIVSYCEEKKISYKQRLAELGINAWSFYDAKRRYAPKQEGDNAGEFLQLIPGGSFLRTLSSHRVREAQTENRRTECCVGKHRAQDSDRHDDADKRQPYEP